MPHLILQEKSNQEIDLTFKLKSLQQSLEQEEAEHKATKAKLADKNKIYQSIEEAKSGALKGKQEGICMRLVIWTFTHLIQILRQ